MNLQGFYTTKGLALAAKVAAGAKLTVTKVAAGSGTTVDSATSLDETKQTLTIGPAEISKQTAGLPATLAEAKASASYTLTELGVYASDPDTGEILYQVFRLEDARAITAGGGSVYRFYLRESVGTGGVTVVCSPAGLITDEDLEPLRGSFSALNARVNAVGTPSRTVTLTAGELVAFIEALPRMLTEHLNLTVTGTLTETLNLFGFYGSGSITINGGGALTLQKGINVASRILIQVRDTTILPAVFASNSSCVYSSFPGCYLYLQRCTLTGDDSSRGVNTEGEGTLLLENCTMTHHAKCVFAARGACVYVIKSGITDATGVFSDNVTGVYVYRGGMVQLCQNAPELLGGSANTHDGGIIINANGAVI